MDSQTEQKSTNPWISYHMSSPNLALGMVSQIGLKSTQPMGQCAVCPNLT
jgi:hypothetical protein